MTPAKKTTTRKPATRKATTKKPPDFEEQRRDDDRVIRIRRGVLEDAVGLILATAEERKLATETIEKIRRAIADAVAEEDE